MSIFMGILVTVVVSLAGLGFTLGAVFYMFPRNGKDFLSWTLSLGALACGVLLLLTIPGFWFWGWFES